MSHCHVSLLSVAGTESLTSVNKLQPVDDVAFLRVFLEVTVNHWKIVSVELIPRQLGLSYTLNVDVQKRV